MSYDPPLNPGEPAQIVAAALETLGLNWVFLANLTGTEESWLRERVASRELSVSEWIALCDALYLSVDFLSYGYFRLAHKANVRFALRGGYFRLPRTRAYWRLRWELFKDFCREWKFHGTHYGLRLRWKVRYRDTLKVIREQLARAHQNYDPQERARMVFRGSIEITPTGLTRGKPGQALEEQPSFT